MKIKLTELMDNFEDVLDTQFNELEEGLSLARIKNLALKGVAIKSSKRRTSKKAMLLVAAAMITLSVTLMAQIISPTFRMIFNERASLLWHHIQPIYKEVKKSGIIVTLEEAVVDETGAMIIFNIRKQDGSTFEEDIEVGEIILDLGGSASFETNQRISEDKKSLMYYILARGDEKIYNKKLTLTLKNIVKAQTQEKVLEKNIYDLYQEYPISKEEPSHSKTGETRASDEWLVQIDQEGLDYHPIEGLEAFSIQAVGFVDGVLHIQTQLERKNGRSSSEARIAYLLNNDTDEALYYHKIHGYSPVKIGSSEVDIQQYAYYLSLTEKLKKMKPVINYTIKEILIEEEWRTTFKLSQNKNTLYKAMRIELEDDQHRIIMSDLYVSVMGIIIKGNSINKFSQQNEIGNYTPVLKVYMKDGSIIHYPHISRGLDRQENIVIEFHLTEGLLDINQVAYMTLNDIKIDLK